MEQTQERPAPVRRRRLITAVTAGVIAAGLALGLTVASLRAADAQSPGPTPRLEQQARPWAGPWGHRGFGMGPGKRMLAFGGPGIHGEFTVRNSDGDFQTVATQLGEVTSVSSSSITVKSEDGFSRTYSVNDKTRVMAGKQDVGDITEAVNKGDTVRVMADVDGSKATAAHILDVTTLKDMRGKLKGFLPKRPTA